MQQNILITARDGFKLSATIRRPLTKIKGVIQINCGTGIPQQVYSNLAFYLTEHGYVTITYDYRGIGNSKPKKLRGFDAKIEDWGIIVHIPTKVSHQSGKVSHLKVVDFWEANFC